MGTSTGNPGQKGNTPLVPSWLDDDAESQQPVLPGEAPGQLPLPFPEEQPVQQPLPAQTPDPLRFSAPRGDFTRFVNSGGIASGNFRCAASNYVKRSLGGSRKATNLLGAARKSTARLFAILGGFASRGVEETSKLHHLGDLIGKSAQDVMLQILDFVCPDVGSTDESIARSSYIEALASIPDWEDRPIESLMPPELLAFIEIYMTNVIECRLVNDIGNKLITLPDNVEQVDDLQSQMKGYIKGAVSDAVTRLKIDIKKIDTAQTKSIVDRIYHTSYDIISSWGGDDL